MASLNVAHLIGNVGEDPAVRYTENSKVARIRLAITERFKDRNGDQKEATEWLDVSAFGKTADFVENYVKKGALLFVEGKIRTRVYKDKNGIERTAFGVVADTVQLLGSRHEEKQEQARPESVPQPRPVQKPAPKPVDDDFPEDDDKLPF